MTDLGYEVVLSAIRGESLGTFEFSRHYGIRGGFKVFRWKCFPFFAQYDFAIYTAILALFVRPDFVFTRHLPVAAFCAAIRIPVICELHSPNLGAVKKQLFRFLVQTRSFQALIVISKPLVEMFYNMLKKSEAERLIERILVSPDGVDLERFQMKLSPSEARTKLGVTERFTAGYSGHLYEGRGIEIIVGLAERNPEVQFLIIGGEDEHILRRKNEAEKRNLANLIFVGFVPNGDLYLYLAACEALLMPYQRKVAVSGGGDTSAWMSPLKMFEYLAMGRGIISSDLPVLREILNTKNAILCPPEELTSWHNALNLLKDDSDRLMSISRCALADSANYSWQRRVQNIFNFSRLRPK